MIELFWQYLYSIFPFICACLSVIGILSIPFTIALKISDYLEKRKKEKSEEAEG